MQAKRPITKNFKKKNIKRVLLASFAYEIFALKILLLKKDIGKLNRKKYSYKFNLVSMPNTFAVLHFPNQIWTEDNGESEH